MPAPMMAMRGDAGATFLRRDAEERVQAVVQVPTPLATLDDHELLHRLSPLVEQLGDDPGVFDARAPLGDALDGAMLLAHSPADDGIHVWTRG